MKQGNDRKEKSRQDANMTRRVKFFTQFDLSAYQTYLEDMSAKGLFFIQRSGAIHTFLKGEPKRRRYYVDLFNKSSNLGGGFINPDTAEYIAYCRECGWRHLDTDGKLQFFVAEDEDAMPIHTDPKLQFTAIRSSMRPWLLSCLILVLLWGFNMKSLIDPVWPTELIEWANVNLFFLGGVLFLLGTMLRYGIFFLRNRGRASRGEPLQFSSGRTVRCAEWLMLAFLAFGVALFVQVILESSTGSTALTVGLLLIAGRVVYGIYKWYRGRVIRAAGGNADISEDVYAQEREAVRSDTWGKLLLFTFAVILVIAGIAIMGTVEVHRSSDEDGGGHLEYYDPVAEEHIIEYVGADAIPLTFEDMGVKNGGVLPEQGKYVGSGTFAEEASSLLGTVLDCSESGYSDREGACTYLGYTVAKCRFDWVCDSVMEEYKNDEHYGKRGGFRDVTEKEGKLWKADRVYAASDNVSEVRIVLRDRTILFIENDCTDYTEEVIADILNELETEL